MTKCVSPWYKNKWLSGRKAPSYLLTYSLFRALAITLVVLFTAGLTIDLSSIPLSLSLSSCHLF